MKRIAVFGACSPVGFGDALQYYNLLNSFNNKLSNLSLVFLCPGLKERLIVFKGLKIKHFCISVSYSPLHIVTRYRHGFIRKDDVLRLYSSINKVDIYNEKTKRSYIDMLVKTLRSKLSTFTNNTRIVDGVENITSLLVFKLLYRPNFNAGVVGGHTLGGGGLTGYVQFYRAVNLMVKGPKIITPISLSLMGFKRNIELLERLKPLLKSFNYIYVRGPYSLKLIKKLFNVDEDKISMCLDSGFWHLLDPVLSQLARNRHARKNRIRVLIYPRKDSFYAYSKDILYRYYLHCLKSLAMKLFKKYDCELVITSPTINGDPLSAPKAVQDFIYVLKEIVKLNSTNFVCVEKPKTIVDSLRLCGSADFVVTSYMHAGIMALSAGVPAIFILPESDTKVLDVLGYLGLSNDEFFFDMFDVKSLSPENLFKKAQNIIENLEYYKKTTIHIVDKALPDAQRAIDNIVKLMIEY